MQNPDGVVHPNPTTNGEGIGGSVNRFYSIQYLLYYAHAITSWGNRMWRFSVGLFLVHISQSLRLTAVYGFSSSVTILLCGAFIGKWIDKNPRLRVAQLALFSQNGLLCFCATIFCLAFLYPAPLLTSPPYYYTAMALTLVSAVLADVASMVSHIVIGKDWVVVIAKENKLNLTNLNATLKRIDLLTNILTPLFVGQILGLVSFLSGAIIIAVWNVVSMILEYALMVKIFDLTPRLAFKLAVLYDDAGDAVDAQTQAPMQMTSVTTAALDAPSFVNESQAPLNPSSRNLNELEKSQNVDVAYGEKRNGHVTSKKLTFGLGNQYRKFLGGWKLYMMQKIKYAGFSLALLYLTVLGFDSITIGYAYFLDVSEAILGAMIALGALTGILGTFLYPRVKKRYGTARCGVYSLLLQLSFLLVSVISIWLPGSPWQPGYIVNQFLHLSTNTTDLGKVDNRFQSVPEMDYPRLDHDLNVNINPLNLNNRMRQPNSTQSNAERIFNMTATPKPVTSNVTNFRDSLALGNRSHQIMTKRAVVDKKMKDKKKVLNETKVLKKGRKYVHISLFLFGIVASRIGLWMIDLTINQIMQEAVLETQKGVINGVQHSLTMVFEIVKYTLVILLPRPQTFGWLIILSYVAIISSLACFWRYTYLTDHTKLGYGVRSEKSAVRKKANSDHDYKMVQRAAPDDARDESSAGALTKKRLPKLSGLKLASLTRPSFNKLNNLTSSGGGRKNKKPDFPSVYNPVMSLPVETLELNAHDTSIADDSSAIESPSTIDDLQAKKDFEAMQRQG